MTRTASKPFQLINIYKSVWEPEYKEPYEIADRDYVAARKYIELNGDFNPDNIIAKAKTFLKLGEPFSGESCRHSFFVFMKQIITLVPEKPKYQAPEAPKRMVKCRGCGVVIEFTRQQEHFEGCEKAQDLERAR